MIITVKSDEMITDECILNSLKKTYMNIRPFMSIDGWKDEICKLLEHQEKYRWHDLRKNPDDLPNCNSQCLCYEHYWNPNEECCECGYVLYWFINGRFSTIGQKVDVIAWREIEPFDEEVIE